MGKPIKLTDQGKAWAIRSLERKVDVRPERERLLIVCEGTKTEPNYFDNIKTKLPKHIAEVIDVEGKGFNTQSLVSHAKRIRDAKKGSDYSYDEVWVVFDRDSFEPDKFDNAIHSATAAGMKVAWSNEAFELWYILHFVARQTGMSRTEYKACLSKYLDTPYQKNDPDMYSKLDAKGNESEAIRRARGLQELHAETPHHDANPCTTVSDLIEKLNSFRNR